jgi:hypothetical protein
MNDRATYNEIRQNKGARGNIYFNRILPLAPLFDGKWKARQV